MVLEDSLQLVSNLTEPEWVKAAQATTTHVELGNHRLDKKTCPDGHVRNPFSRHTEGTVRCFYCNPPVKKAWWTCDQCPQPLRWYPFWEWADVVPGTPGNRKKQLPGKPGKWLSVKRCKKCARRKNRHQRAKKDLKESISIWQNLDDYDKYAFRFVDLTVPNFEFTLEEGYNDGFEIPCIRHLKKLVANFARTKEYQEKVIGSIEFYEATYAVNEHRVSVNAHVHCVWLGKYWSNTRKDPALESAWKHGYCSITKVKGQKATMKYISKYVTKDELQGVRCKERRGVLRRSRPTS